MATDVVPVVVGDGKKDVAGETKAEITQEEKDDQLNGDYEVDDGVDERQEDNTVDDDENEEDLVGVENEGELVGDENEEDEVDDENEEDLAGDENEEDVVGDDENEEDLDGDENEEDVVGDGNEEDLVGDENEEDLGGDEDEEYLGGDDQTSIETNINKDSTENRNIATDSAVGDAASDAKGFLKEQMDSATDAIKDAKRQMDASQNTVFNACKGVKQQVGQLFAPSNNNNTPAAGNQQQQPQPQRRQPQQKPQGRRQTQQKVSVATPQEQQPMQSDSTPQPPTQPRQRQKPQGRRPTQQKVSVPTPQEQQPTDSDSTPQPQQQPTESDSTPQPPTQPRPRQKPQGRRPAQQKVSVPTLQGQQPTESDSTPQPQQQPTASDSTPQLPTQPRQRQKPQGRRPTQQKVSVPTPQKQQPTESDSTPQPQQQPMESDSTPQPPMQPRQRPQKERQPQKKVSVTPQAQQPQQQPQQKVSVSPSQAQAQQPQQQPQQQKVSVSPPEAQAQQTQQQPQQKVSVSPQAQAQQQVNKVTDSPPNTEPQPQQQLEMQANPSVREGGTIPSGVVNIPAPEEDATALYTAFKGRGCNVGQLLHVLTKRDATHRHLIQQHYKKNYGEDLIDRISSELSSLGDLKEKVGLDLTVNPTGTLGRTFSSNIKRAVSLWMFEESERDATIVWQALQVTSFDKAAVTEVICSRTPSQLSNLQRAYHTKFSSQLLQEINASNVRFNGSHKELLIACLDSQARDEGTNVDLKMAEEDAKQLYEDGEKIWGTNNRTFINIFTKRNRPHLVAVDAAYIKLYGHSLEKAVEKETTRSFKTGLLTLLSCAKNPAKYFAEVLYNAMKGVGTSDTTLIRTVVTRAGIDMEDVKKEYAQAYKQSLKDAIHRDTSGDYRTFLISLVE